jgi:hypothetical protein
VIFLSCCADDEGFVAPRDRPSGGGLKPPRCCGGREAVVVSDRGKGAVEVSGGDQEGVALKAPGAGVFRWGVHR